MELIRPEERTPRIPENMWREQDLGIGRVIAANPLQTRRFEENLKVPSRVRHFVVCVIGPSYTDGCNAREVLEMIQAGLRFSIEYKLPSMTVELKNLFSKYARLIDAISLQTARAKGLLPQLLSILAVGLDSAATNAYLQQVLGLFALGVKLELNDLNEISNAVASLTSRCAVLQPCAELVDEAGRQLCEAKAALDLVKERRASIVERARLLRNCVDLADQPNPDAESCSALQKELASQPSGREIRQALKCIKKLASAPPDSRAKLSAAIRKDLVTAGETAVALDNDLETLQEVCDAREASLLSLRNNGVTEEAERLMRGLAKGFGTALGPIQELAATLVSQAESAQLVIPSSALFLQTLLRLAMFACGFDKDHDPEFLADPLLAQALLQVIPSPEFSRLAPLY